MFAILDKAKPGTESIRGLNLVAVRHTTLKMARLPLWPKLLLFSAWTDTGLAHIVYIYIYSVTNMCITCNLYIFTNNGRIMTMTNDRPDLSSEGAPNIEKTVNVTQKLISGHETQMGLETRTY
jgi:hypothetical protein